MAKNWAIAIGINEYNNLRSLRYAKRDAESMRDFFLEEVGFDKVFLFTEDSPKIAGAIPSQPSFANLRRFLRSNFEQPLLEAGDNLWFFFAGHGQRHNERDYLMPFDVDPGDIEHTAISVSYVSERLRRSGADNVILLLDACRNEGSRDGLGIGEERHTGIITISACSPKEVSWEIKELAQGAFTHSLLEALRIQGEGNCATVERLYQHLQYRVPEINRYYGKLRQTPYAIAEPATKLHLILLPRQATGNDIATLIKDALTAEVEDELELAEQLWIRVLAVSPANPEALKGYKRIIRKIYSRETTSSPIITNPSGSRSQTSSQKPVSPSGELSPKSEKGEALADKNPDSPNDLVAPMLHPYTQISTFPRDSLQIFQFDVITVDREGKETNRTTSKAEYFPENLGNGVTLEMVSIPGGTFMMGSPESEEGHLNYESPQHKVTVPPFFMGKYPVTQAQWRVVAGLPQVNRSLEPNPSHFKGDNLPVEQISWYDSEEFCARLSKSTGRNYRLPSESEWEYACRAGTTTPFHFGETITTDLANYNGNYVYGKEPKGIYRKSTTEVGSSGLANSFGLYDMHGNIWEWCADTWRGNYTNAPNDGSPWIDKNNINIRLLRGGSWYNYPRYCRS
ncbi:SUMF1/EgtB/PvdO family nonheme iron enzyme [Limnofasciculus baicalensis]|uniref:SUMF1/EgtB/PvdO family nonheme iron enzyme n=1 Tax=Limnofasciculus baicalensis TaxID=3064906 RepID=UPI002814D6D7|nr:SUMF1/EgtB/PvdO family nonheme iron enzyme [Limnofasciculus baicalensis]